MNNRAVAGENPCGCPIITFLVLKMLDTKNAICYYNFSTKVLRNQKCKKLKMQYVKAGRRLAMTTNEFRNLMIGVMQMQIDAIVEHPGYESSRLLQGKELGLMIAIDKLKAAAFLTEEKDAAESA